MARPDQAELKFIADRLIEKVWQGDEAKRGIATQAASVALAAIQDHTAARYMETADKFTGRSLMQLWLNREAHASVALDGETQSVEGAFIDKVVEHEATWTVAEGGSYRCTRSWPDGTQCDNRSAMTTYAVHRKVLPSAFTPFGREDEFTTTISAADEDMLDGLPDKSPKLEEVARRRRAQENEIKQTPTEWSRLKRVIVRDPDGWRGDKGRPWTDAITEREFDQRAAVSTVEERDAALNRIVTEDRELLDRLAQENAHPDGWRDDL